PRTSLDDLSLQLMGGGTEVKSVTWEHPKQREPPCRDRPGGRQKPTVWSPPWPIGGTRFCRPFEVQSVDSRYRCFVATIKRSLRSWPAPWSGALEGRLSERRG